MTQLTLQTLFDCFGVTVTSAESLPITEVIIDSRQAVAGSLFWAFAGEQTDGHRYIGTAFAAGAIAAVVEHPDPAWPAIDLRVATSAEWDYQTPIQLIVSNSLVALQQFGRYWRQKFDVRIIGITGSVGKTSTKEMIAAVLSQSFNTLKSAGNRNNEIGLPLTLLQLRPEHERVVLEMGMYTQGEIALLCDIAQPQVGVLTLIGTVHLERVGTIEALIAGKRELVESLPADGVAILNHDDPAVMSMVPYTQAKPFTYGLTSEADLWADEIESHGLRGVSFTLHYQEQKMPVTISLLGRHSVYTALRAAAVGIVEGMHWQKIAEGLASYRDPLRLIVIDGIQQSTILDDSYNASPDSTIAALDLLGDLTGRKIAVLGDMLELGSDEIDGHRRVGRKVVPSADYLVAVGKLGRIIGEEALTCGMSADAVCFTESAEKAIPLLLNFIQPKDTLLIKASRGLHLDQLVRQLVERKA